MKKEEEEEEEEKAPGLSPCRRQRSITCRSRSNEHMVVAIN